MNEQLMKEMFSGMIGDYLLLQSQVEAQGVLLLMLASSAEEGDDPIAIARKYDNNLRKSVQDIYNAKVASHPYLDTAWKQKLRKDLEDIPGILIADTPTS